MNQHFKDMGTDSVYDKLVVILTEHFQCYFLVGFDVLTGERIMLGHAPTSMHESACTQFLKDAVEEIHPTQVELVNGAVDFGESDEPPESEK